MREIFIERRDRLLRIAIKENKVLTECFIEEESFEPLPGEIYKGVIKNIVPAIKCAFIDIGHDKNAYMYINPKDKSKSLKKGQDILIEVTKEELGDKGAKVNGFISIPGRYTVINNLNTGVSFSQKIKDENFKSYIKDNMVFPKDIAVVIRTNAQFVDVDIINEEIKKLYATYEDIYTKFNYTLKPKKLYGEGGIIYKILRDSINGDTASIVVDNPSDYNIIKEYIEGKPDINIDINHYEGHRNLFDYYEIEKEILALRNHRVPLGCGGHIVIDKTEAMYVVDVNSGKNVSHKTMDKTAYITNLQAAKEIARQIRLRNLSGIIVIDFIDMKYPNHRAKVIEALNEGFYGDKNKTVIYPFTDLNLIQIARMRRGKNIYDYIEENCTECSGRGTLLKLSYISLLIRNEILKVDAENRINNIYIEINNRYEEAIKGNIIGFITEIEGLDKNIYLNFVESTEYFKVEPLIFINQIENVKRYKVEI
ncbi:Rne/Rng family ribonuclease [Clostridium amazonitimonense]|uniref:Rne/Rng family ribonuclease n=1 Tax=Clostridium amazonitimonense TaxID=1499689 RepID=UPI000509DE2E|nr:Rne/Rng family ribonuclease [Clostridium amazonitimonense]